LLKSKQNQKLISTIVNNGKTYSGQEKVTEGICEFYTELYEARPTQKLNDNFYDKCPKLTEQQSKFIDNELSLEEVLKSLKSCKDSAPGPDGIPYIVYRRLWKIAGPIILDSWNFSIKNKTLPPSHYESVITLLPKDGKDTRDIKNWRPITLSNCDAKIITKALATKMSKVLESIIDKSQTAYVSGRSVSDNLRSNFFLKSYCKQNKLDAVLISLDAKKAFDSVDHKYIEETLRAYGFGEGFINTFNILYKGITSKILVNGFLSKPIKIERGVKQGDALSCAIFILCIDPLLRNINSSKKIKGISIKQKSTGRNPISFKAGAYADDVSVICMNDKDSIQNVFNEYSRLTNRSGLELNADKTEILNVKSDQIIQITFNYNGQQIKINTISKLKICGLYYSSIDKEEYDLNVTDKIKLLADKIKLWTPRNLTIEGKILIVKTFGLSQLIYNMQSYGFNETELKVAERTIFKFIWSTSENQNGIDRISRKIMKNEYEHGGMKVTDVECLDRSLKLKQFIRAQKSSHEISNIQQFITEEVNSSSVLKQEYSNINSKEKICQSAQETINIITDYNRNSYVKLTPEEFESDRILIDEIASINLKTYLERKGRLFHICILKQLSKEGITTLGELSLAYEHECDVNTNKKMKIILSAFPKVLINIVKCYNEDINNDKINLEYLLVSPSKRVKIEDVTTKELQTVLKLAMNKVEAADFLNRLGFEYQSSNILQFRKHCSNAKLRNIYFRLIHKDFFTHVRMKRFKMTETDKCPRCGQTETTEHLLWECIHSQSIWTEYNNYMRLIGQTKEIVQTYDKIYTPGNNSGTALIKIKVTQELIQMNRPVHWNKDKMENLIDDLLKMENYIAKKNHFIEKFNRKWIFLTRNTDQRVQMHSR
jgi:hypothetical protein